VDKFSTNEDLIEVLTVFIFITSAVHASLNFGQYDVYGFPPNYPTVMNHTKWPTTKVCLLFLFIIILCLYI